MSIASQAADTNELESVDAKAVRRDSKGMRVGAVADRLSKRKARKRGNPRLGVALLILGVLVCASIVRFAMNSGDEDTVASSAAVHSEEFVDVGSDTKPIPSPLADVAPTAEVSYFRTEEESKVIADEFLRQINVEIEDEATIADPRSSAPVRSEQLATSNRQTEPSSTGNADATSVTSDRCLRSSRAGS